MEKLLLPLLVSFVILSGPLFADEIKVPEQIETIQAAIDSTDPGDIITVSAGTYYERIQLKPGIILRSEGSDEKGEIGLKRAEVTIIDGSKGPEKDAGVKMAEGASLNGFTVTKVGNYDDKVWQENWDQKGDMQSHDHIGEFGTPGIAITGVNCQVINNIVHHVGNTGIAVRGVDGKRCSPVISKNTCYRNMGGGIGSMTGSEALITDNVCYENFYAGIGHDNASPLVTGNVCYNNIRAGIGVSEGACPIVRNNQCYNNRRAGIGIRTEATTRPVIENNDCFDNGMAGIGCEEDAAPIIRGNRCYNNTLAGIGVTEHASPLVSDNHCYENKAAGIGLNGSSAILHRNRIEKNGAAGIGISAGSKAIAIDNAIVGNRLVAVGIPKDGEGIFVGNTMERAGGMPPIIAVFEGSSAVMIDNDIKGGGVSAILLNGSLRAMDNRITGNNGGSGIWAKENSDASLIRNEITGYKIPIREQGGKVVIVD